MFHGLFQLLDVNIAEFLSDFALRKIKSHIEFGLVVNSENHFRRADVVCQNANPNPRFLFGDTGIGVVFGLVVDIEVSRIAHLVIAHEKRNHHLETALILNDGIIAAHCAAH